MTLLFWVRPFLKLVYLDVRWYSMVQRLLMSHLEKWEWSIGEKLWLLKMKECDSSFSFHDSNWTFVHFYWWNFIFKKGFDLHLYEGKCWQVIPWVWNREKVPDLFIFPMSSLLSTLSQWAGDKEAYQMSCNSLESSRFRHPFLTHFVHHWAVPFLPLFSSHFSHILFKKNLAAALAYLIAFFFFFF